MRADLGKDIPKIAVDVKCSESETTRREDTTTVNFAVGWRAQLLRAYSRRFYTYLQEQFTRH